MIKQYLQQSTSQNGIARYFATENTVELANLIPPTVSYETSGDTLIIGPTRIIERIAEQLPQVQSITLLSVDGEKGKNANIYFADSIQVSGYLGAFDVQVQNHNVTTSLSKVAIGKESFDIILDMSLNGVMTEEVPVPGYFPVGRGYPKLADALEQIPNLIGTFDKPKFFRLNTDLCAHSSRGVKGCERCVDACPAGALSSEGSDKTGHRIEINPYLCQGIGTCATACPTEAIHYALPTPKETQKFIERLLSNYFQAGGEKPIVLICSSEHETYNLMALKVLPENVIPVTVEELPSVGIDTWFAALTNGATQVLFAASRHMPKTIQRVLEQEVATAQTLLYQLGLAKETINILYLETLREGAPNLVTEDLQLRLGELEGNKRTRLFTSLDALAQQFHIEQVAQPLEASSVYGTIKCSTKECTLCMGCVAVCPTRALHHEGEIPSIKFVEQDCVQCGLCVKACPENALTRVQQMNWNKAERQAVITLHQEEPAKCLRCHKPFAPQSMIAMLQTKLQGHSHFATAEALNRIAMCEDCRVIDVFESMANDPEQQLRY